MNSNERKIKMIEFFNDRANQGKFDSYTPDERKKLNALLDDVQFPGNEILTVLDCGCGTGRAVEVIAERLKSGSTIYGADLSPVMIERAIKTRNAPEGIQFIFKVADCMALPFTDEFFDWVLVMDSFAHFSDAKSALLEFKRVLKDGGYFAILDMKSSQETNRHHREIGGVVAGDLIPDTRQFLAIIRDADLWLQIYIDDSDGLRVLARK